MNQSNKSIWKWMGLIALLSLAILFGCNQNEQVSSPFPGTPPESNTATPQEKPDETEPGKAEPERPTYTGGPAQIIIADVNSGMRANEDWVEEFFQNPVRKIYPEIEVTMASENVATLITAGTPPDIVLVSNPSLHTIVDLDLPEDLTDMVRKYNIHLADFDPVVIDEIRSLSNGQFYGIPFSMNYGATIYNKDIFDRFGVDYPDDEMTWDEYYELAQNLTRMDEGVQYRGILPPAINQMLRQFGAPVVDRETETANLTSPAHIEALSLVTKFYSIPNYMDGDKYELSQNMFYVDKTIAIYPWWIAAINSSLRNDGVHESFAWDLTTFPALLHKPDVGKQVDFHMALVNKSSKHSEAAYQVVLGLISEEVQSGLSRVGRISPLVDENIRSLFGSESNMFDGKNLQSIFKVKPAPMPYVSKFNAKIETLLRSETTKMIMVDKIDINTALSQAEEKANKEITIED